MKKVITLCFAMFFLQKSLGVIGQDEEYYEAEGKSNVQFFENPAIKVCKNLSRGMWLIIADDGIPLAQCTDCGNHSGYSVAVHGHLQSSRSSRLWNFIPYAGRCLIQNTQSKLFMGSCYHCRSQSDMENGVFLFPNAGNVQLGESTLWNVEVYDEKYAFKDERSHLYMTRCTDCVTDVDYDLVFAAADLPEEKALFSLKRQGFSRN